MGRIALLLVVTLLAGCGHAGSRSPRDRYRAAVDAKLAGDGAAYWRELVALAHDVPDTREGRRARATLTSGDVVSYAATVGIVAAIAIPNFLRFQQRARQSEAPASLRALGAWEAAEKRRTGRYSAAVPAGTLDARRYFCFVAPGRLVALPADPGDLTAERASAVVEGMLGPGRGLLAIAVGNVDDDEALDVWALDEAGTVTHVQDDLE